MKKLSTLFLAGMFAAGGAAIAQDDVKFNELDQDGDGQLSRTEVAQNGDLAANFSRMDMDGDGYLDENEVQDASMQGQDQEFQATGSETGVQETEDDFQETGVQDQQSQDQQAEDDFQSDDFQETSVETDTDDSVDETDRDSGTADDWR